nr:FAD-dependent oxidoreductase [Lachnospiraceae bacterium]
MVRITQLKVPITYDKESLPALAAEYLKLDKKKIAGCELIRESLDARKKPELLYSLVVDVSLTEGKRAEGKLLAQ